MEPTLEQASHILDQALISYAAGQIEAGCEHIAAAAAMLHEIQVSALPQEVAAAGAEQAEFLGILSFEMPLALPSPAPVTAVVPAVRVKSARESSLAVAA